MRALLVTGLLALSLPGAAAASIATDARDAARKAGFSSIAERVGKAALPAVRLDRSLQRMPRTLGTSRMGGTPDLPLTEPWPSCKGKAQSFLLQLRLSSLPREAADLRRLGGHLLVFTHVEFEDPGDTSYGLWAGDCTTVIHVPAGRAVRRRSAPKGTPVMRLRPARITPRLRPDLPDTMPDSRRLGPPLRSIVLPDEPALERWWRLRERLVGKRDAHHALGYVEAPNGGDDCYARTQRPTRTWRHLVTVNHDLTTRFEVADGGRLQVAISPADLRAGRFDRACGIFDSA